MTRSLGSYSRSRKEGARQDLSAELERGRVGQDGGCRREEEAWETVAGSG